MKHSPNRKTIIEAARKLITRNGIRAARVDELATSLGMSKRTIYKLFEDKVSLIGSCLEQIKQRGLHTIYEKLPVSMGK